jgi:hypothetical protein
VVKEKQEKALAEHVARRAGNGAALKRGGQRDARLGAAFSQNLNNLILNHHGLGDPVRKACGLLNRAAARALRAATPPQRRRAA